MKKRTGKLIHGVGINDVDYAVQVLRTIGYDADGKQIQKLEWFCPYHSTWKGMLKRCYSEAFLRTTPSYRGCTVTEHWLTFSNFKSWMMTQDWHGKQLDKDILFTGNKIYSPDTCVFVSSRINTFLLGCEKGRGEFPIGVHWDTRREVFVAKVRTGDGRENTLGTLIIKKMHTMRGLQPNYNSRKTLLQKFWKKEVTLAWLLLS